MLAGCISSNGTTVQIEWFNLVQFGGIQYTADFGSRNVIPAAALGPVFATVRFELNGNVHDTGRQVADGDAAYLKAGTPVYSVRGYATTFRLAAYFTDGTLLAYEAWSNPHATRGSDLLDIGGKVTSISVNNNNAQQTQPGTITDSTQVATLVSEILQAPVDQQHFLTHGEQSLQVGFHLRDGTTVSRIFWPDSGELTLGIRAPAAFSAAIIQASKRAK